MMRLAGSAVLLLLTGCNVTRYLDAEKGERLLKRNTVQLEAGRKLTLAERNPIRYELQPFFKQQPNKRSFLFFNTRLWFYYRYRHADTTKVTRFIWKNIDEPPVIFSKTLSQRTAENFENQLQQRGYLHARCTWKPDTLGQFYMGVRYLLNLGEQQRISTVSYESKDAEVRRIVLDTRKDSELQPGVPVDADLFDREKLRITKALKDRGYAYFNPGFIEFTGDSTGNTTQVKVNILTPSDTVMHKLYRFNKINVFYGFIPEIGALRQDTTIGDIYFATTESKFVIQPRHLYNSVNRLKKYNPYNQTYIENLSRELNGMGIFRFVSIKPTEVRDTLSELEGKIDVDIAFSTNTHYSTNNDFDFNYRNSERGPLLGLSGSTRLVNRNAFRGAEQLQLSGEYNVEFVNPNQNNGEVIFSQEIKIKSDLFIPRFSNFLGYWNALEWMFKRDGAFYTRLKREARTRITLGYDRVNLTGFFNYDLFNAGFGYDYRPNPRNQFAFNHIGIDVLRPEFDPDFNIENIFLKRSFDNQLFTGVLLRSFSYSHLGRVSAVGGRFNLRLNGEVSGFEENLLHSAWEQAFGKQEWKVADLEFAKFGKVDADVVYTREISKDLVAAFRLGVGLIAPFGGAASAPYVKQFFVGGPNSMRAWRIRELGPGGYYLAQVDSLKDARFYQSGDVRLELNAEMRFPLFLYAKGAIFLDAGNVWTLREDVARPGAAFSSSFYNDIAVGTGAGLRLDFGYFLLRLDVGLRLRNPYKDEGGYWIVAPLELKRKNINYNLAVNYPF